MNNYIVSQAGLKQSPICICHTSALSFKMQSKSFVLEMDDASSQYPWYNANLCSSSACQIASVNDLIFDSLKLWSYSSSLHIHHEYLDTWQPNIGDEHRLMREPNNKVDSNAVAVVSKYSRKNVVHRKSAQNVKHLEQMSSKVCLHPNEMSADFQVVGHVTCAETNGNLAHKVSKTNNQLRKSSNQGQTSQQRWFIWFGSSL